MKIEVRLRRETDEPHSSILLSFLVHNQSAFANHYIKSIDCSTHCQLCVSYTNSCPIILHGAPFPRVGICMECRLFVGPGLRPCPCGNIYVPATFRTALGNRYEPSLSHGNVSYHPATCRQCSSYALYLGRTSTTRSSKHQSPTQTIRTILQSSRVGSLRQSLGVL